jgi:hypothetical protein
MAAAWASQRAAWVELLAGDAIAAERILRPAYETLQQMGATADLQVVGSYLAEAMYVQCRYEEAELLAVWIEELDPTAILEVAYARCARAKSLARMGQIDQAERLAREAVALVEPTDFFIDRADARMSLAEVVYLGDRFDEAGELAGEALWFYEQKGNLVLAERARALLAQHAP